MKLVIVNGMGKSIGELKLSQELLRRPDVLSERVSRVIASSITANNQPDESDRIVENAHGLLEGIDDDSDIMDVPLNLKEACTFDFDKHVDAIVDCENVAREEHKHKNKTNINENVRRYDARYKERPGNLIRYK